MTETALSEILIVAACYLFSNKLNSPPLTAYFTTKRVKLLCKCVGCIRSPVRIRRTESTRKSPSVGDRLIVVFDMYRTV